MAGDTMQAKRRATYEDLLQVPDTKVAEIIDGELIVSPRPASPHALAAAEIGYQLGPTFHGPEAPSGPGGWWILPEPELHLGEDVLVPDLAGWRCTRMPVFSNTPAFTLAPDWLCEIVSPSSVRRDRIAKMRSYAREGVGSVWLVDPIARTLESFRLDGDRWVLLAVYGDADAPRVDPFAEAELRLVRWWIPATDPA
jgi:Uma2 family endonuclease